MGLINPLFSVCHQKNNVRERFRHDIAHTRCFSRCIVNRKAGLASDDAYKLAAFHDIQSIRPSIGVMAVRYTLAAFHDIQSIAGFFACIVPQYTLAAFHDIQSMFRAYHKDHQVIILHLSLEKLALEGAFQGITPQICAALHQKQQVFRRFQAGFS